MLPTPPEGLRHWCPEDAPALAAAWADPSITRWNPPPPGADPAAWIAGVEDRWARRLALDLVIEPPDERADRRVGRAGDPERADRRAGRAGDPERADRRAGRAGDPERADPPVAGEAGLSGFTTDPGRAELGVWVAAGQRRTGLATHAVRTMTAWALTELALDQVWARTDPANAPAEALFERLGWDRLGERSGKTIWSATPALLR